MRGFWLFVFCLLAWQAVLGADILPRCEHPRPDLFRSSWQCLNGKWDFAFDPKNQGFKERWWEKSSFEQKITVPFEIESKLSGITQKKKSKYFWYLRTFKLSPKLAGEGRIILHFEAVDYHAWVWLNGKFLGEHIGGYTPFSFDITDALVEGENRLVVRVFDSSNQKQVRGKQSSRGKGYIIYYTPASGIWQTVWLERVGESWLENFHAYFEQSKSQLRLEIKIKNPKPEYSLDVLVYDEQGKSLICAQRNIPVKDRASALLKFKNPKLWSPSEPYLYQLKFLIKNTKGKVVDEVQSYMGLREVSVRNGRVFLNGKPIYQKLVLVQGYYPPGNYSPESDEAFKKDLLLIKEMGFNGLRMHQKIEAKRFYFWADKLGVLVWEEMPAMCAEFPSMFLPLGKKWQEQFEKEWQEVIERDFNHPSIIVRVAFNESWGVWQEIYSPSIKRFREKIVKMTKELDPTRLVVDNSGWLHKETDILDIHQYLPSVKKTELLYKELARPWNCIFSKSSLKLALRGVIIFPPLFPGIKYQGEPIVISEYGGFGFYRTKPRSFLENYQDYTLAIGKYPYLQGYCYTQLYDVEQEKNGLVDEMRVPKVPLEEIRKINQKVGW